MKNLNMKKSAYILIFILIFMSIPLYSLKSQENCYYQQQVDYKIDVDMEVEKNQFKGKQTIIYKNNSPDTLKVFYFHLYWNAFQPGSLMDQQINTLKEGADGRMQADGVSRISKLTESEIGYHRVNYLKQGGTLVEYTVDGTIMTVKLNRPILPHSKTTFEMEWSSQVPVQIRRSGRNNSEGIDFTMTQWYPKVVEYDYEGWHTFDYLAREFHGVFANYEVNINIDKDYIIGAGGILGNPKEVKGYDNKSKQKIKEGKTLWKFKAKNIHDFAWAADPDYTIENFQVPDGPQIYYVYQKSEDTRFWEEAKPKVVQFYQIMKERFGSYDYPLYSFIQGGDGGMEYGMCTMILGHAKTLENLCQLMFHEAAHSWFQQMLASNENMRPWMDEGFTTFAEEICIGEIFPNTVKDIPNVHFNSLGTYVQYVNKYIDHNQEEALSTFADNFKSAKSYSMASYIKGNIFLVQLEYIVGKKVFDKIMKEYVKTWKFKHPTERDLLHIAQKISGMNLKWYWNYMINTKNTINYAIKKVDTENSKLFITLENKGDFPMPLDVYFVNNDDSVVIYNIPLNIMRGAKEQEFEKIPQVTLKAWEVTQKEYHFEVDFEVDLHPNEISIDFTRMADINYKDNKK